MRLFRWPTTKPRNRTTDGSSSSISSGRIRKRKWPEKKRPPSSSATSSVRGYFKGPGEQWKTGLPTWRRIVYSDLWPGIDLVFEGTVNRLKYSFHVRPGADSKRMRLAYRGATKDRVRPIGRPG